MASTPQSTTESEDLRKSRSPQADDIAKGDQLLVDETSIESFPASDPPAWTGTHAGPPRSKSVRTETPRELRAQLRSIATRMPTDGARTAGYIADTFLEAGRSVLRIPSSRHPEVEILEAVVRGTEERDELVIAARYDQGPAAIAVLLGLARLIEGRQPLRSIRLVAYAGDGSADYADRLLGQSITLCGALCLDSVGFLADRSVPRTWLVKVASRLLPSWAGTFVALIGDQGARALLEVAGEAFAQGTTLTVRTLLSPVTLPFLASPDCRAFASRGYPAVVVTDTGPLRSPPMPITKARASELNYDAMADVVFGLSCVAAKLTGGAAA